MIICGIKLTHDGSIALIDNGQLKFSYEMEKINNGARHADFHLSMNEVEDILKSFNYTLDSVDKWVIDGWDDWDPSDLGNHDEKTKSITIPYHGKEDIQITQLNDYGHLVGENDNVLLSESFVSEGHKLSYNSFKHVTGHVAGAYCTSPFAERKEDSYVLVWDGGMPPQLFYYHYEKNEVQNLGHLFFFMGYIYINFAHAFEPFSAFTKHLSIAGKAMAYMALGSEQKRILNHYHSTYSNLKAMAGQIDMSIDAVAALTEEFIKEAKNFCDREKMLHQDMLATFQVFLQELLVETLENRMKEYPNFKGNLCFAGGSALNIKWNNKIRNIDLVEEMWVPPFPNDAGSALGTACGEMMVSDEIRALDWSVYSAPELLDTELVDDQYQVQDCSLEELAFILHQSNEPLVFLNGRAEIGPRALGNRSILASAASSDMKKRLNQIKGREGYRPVAPICLEEGAAKVFDPGTPDPYMLYEHLVRPEWKSRVPTICHLDGTARLQTVNKDQNDKIFELLTHFNRISGMPLLCNTSANLHGKGFFPDVKSVMDWNEVNFIWNDNKVYFKNRTADEVAQLKQPLERVLEVEAIS